MPGHSRATGWHQGGSSAPSLASGAAVLPGLPRIGRRVMEELKPRDVRDLVLAIVREKKLAPRTIRNVYGVLRTARALDARIARAGALEPTAALLLAPAVEAAGPLVIDGLAVVQTDGTLSINGTVVRLFGIYLPMRERTWPTP